MQTVNFKLVSIALEHTSGVEFEHFFYAFYPAVAGIEFVPLGGVHDGGADAFQGEGMFEGEAARPGTFYQATTQENHRAKIRHTVNRLRKFGRELKTLQYFTSRTVALIDEEEETLSAELDVNVRIRDRKWIVANINRSPQTIAAFQTYLAPNLAFLSELGSAKIIKSSPELSVRTMCVFLGQEIDRRRGNTDLLEAVTDSLILWALDGTDPDAGKFMTLAEILAKIEEALPSAKHFVRGVIHHRLEKLSTKGNPSGREVRWHKKQDHYCLPYETRQIVEQENAEDEFLKLQVLDLYQQRAREMLDHGDDLISDQVANLAHKSLGLTFEREGLELAEFLSGLRDENHSITIADQVDEAIAEADLGEEAAIKAKEITLAVLRQAFYNSTETERVYYGKLSRTYALMFTLWNEPKIVEYFKGMSSNFVLLVGTDILVRALSERYLADEDQMTTNMLRILRDAGSTLILTQMVVDEVHAHLAGTDYEFQNWFMEIEPYVDKEIARHSNKILIRAYFYAKFDPLLGTRPAGWKSFVEQFCSYRDLHNPAVSKGQLKNYLIETFGFEYLDSEDIAQLTVDDEVQELAEKIKEIKSDDVLALNDARQILAIYGKRRLLNEDHCPNPYGYRTWWLTHETKVRRCTGELVMARGSPYIIRPEFILNFIALSPKTDEVRKSYGSVFPTLLGVRLSNRMREDIFHDVMRRAKAVRDVSDARAKVMMVEMSNCLKGDNFKRYEAQFTRRFDV